MNNLRLIRVFPGSWLPAPGSSFRDCSCFGWLAGPTVGSDRSYACAVIQTE